MEIADAISAKEKSLDFSNQCDNKIAFGDRKCGWHRPSLPCPGVVAKPVGSVADDRGLPSNARAVDRKCWHKINVEADNVYSTDYGWGLFRDTRNGVAKNAKYRRYYTWNEKNQLVSSSDAQYTVNYVYGQDGQRASKYTTGSETLYFNKMWSHHTDGGNSHLGGHNIKNIYLGETRVVTKLAAGHETTAHEEVYKQFYYHSDHMGSAALITDYRGDEYQRLEYTESVKIDVA